MIRAIWSGSMTRRPAESVNSAAGADAAASSRASTPATRRASDLNGIGFLDKITTGARRLYRRCPCWQASPGAGLADDSGFP
jgi:hypothetical protein